MNHIIKIEKLYINDQLVEFEKAEIIVTDYRDSLSWVLYAEGLKQAYDLEVPTVSLKMIDNNGKEYNGKAFRDKINEYTGNGELEGFI